MGNEGGQVGEASIPTLSFTSKGVPLGNRHHVSTPPPPPTEEFCCYCIEFWSTERNCWGHGACLPQPLEL